MAHAKLTSIEVLETFRASLIVFSTDANRSLDEAGDQLRRTRYWIQHDQRMHWEGQLRQRRKILGQAEQELISAKLSALRDSITAQQMAVLKARRAVVEAEEKLRSVKLWNRDYDTQADPLNKRLEGLRQYLSYDLPKAIAFLLQAQRTLESYAQDGRPASETTLPQSPDLPVNPPTES